MVDKRPESSQASSIGSPEKLLPAYKGSEPYIFICYSHREDDVVYDELRWLQEAGVNVWYDEGISGGTIWRAELAERIEKARLVLFFASPASAKSEHCNRELNYALECNRPILPVYLEETELPGDLRLGLARVQAIHRHALPGGGYREKVLAAIARAKPRPMPVEAAVQSSKMAWLAFTAVLIIAAIGAWFALDKRTQTTSPSVRSLAVLPFDNLSDDPEQEYFVAGMHDAVISELSRIGPLRVISRTSTLPYTGSDRPSLPQIARELGVDAIIEASVLKADGDVRIQVQLIQAFPEEKHLWAEAYDRGIGDVLAMHSDVAWAIAQAVEVELTQEHQSRLVTRRTVNPATYEAYLRGTYHIRKFTPEGFQKGLAYLHEAIENDPAD
ncbi:MAG: TIR domain-containing protein, partial [Gammaproteobacteria bacterium]